MQLTLSPTTRIEKIDGAPCRVWKGVDQDGVEIIAWIRMVSPQTHDADVNAVFAEKLQALPTPRAGAMSIDWRFIL